MWTIKQLCRALAILAASISAIHAQNGPTISSISDQTIFPNITNLPIPFVVTAVGTPVATLSISGNSSNTALIPTNGMVFGGSGTNRTLTIAPARNQSGSTVVTITVTDTNGASTGTSFTVNVAFTFSNVMANLPAGGAYVWWDYNNDGLPDVLFLGSLIQLLRNNGDGSFTAVAAGLPAIQGVAGAWGDYNNDGFLDIALCGWNGTNYVSGIYRNNGDGTFTDIQPGLPAQIASLAWGDFDNDGQLDLLVQSNSGTDVYRNNHGIFTAAHAGLPACSFTQDAWGDYNRDGFMDLLVEDGQTSVYKNNGDGTFTNIGANMQGIYEGFAAWGDYDNDGYLDVAVTGSTGPYPTNRTSLIYHNNHDDTFTNINAGIYPLNFSAVAWGDYDNDGWLDIIDEGWTNYTGDFWTPALVYHNNGDGTFTDAPLQFTAAEGAAFIDFNNDNALDLLVVDGLGRPTLWQNKTPKKDTPPTAPTSLTQTPLVNNDVRLYWALSTDAETTNPAGLCYNLRMGTTPGGIDVISPQADAITGKRRVQGRGNGSSTNSWLIRNLPPGTYYWSVQAIDPSFVGSLFAVESSFTLTNARPQISAINNVSTSHAFPTPVIPFTVSDDTTPASDLLVTAHFTDTNIFPDSNIVLGGAGSNRTFQFFPVLNHVGTNTATITVQDAQAFTSGSSFVVSVTNAAPTVKGLTNFSLDMNHSTPAIPFTIGDLETPASNLIVQANSGNLNLVLLTNIVLGGSGSNRTLTITPAFGWSGSATITVTALDSLGTPGSAAFTLSVTNQPPTISAIPDQYAVPGQPVPAVPFVVGDLETPVSNLVVTFTSSNPSLVPASNIISSGLGNNRTLNITPATNSPGRTVITVSVNDGANGNGGGLGSGAGAITSVFFVLNIENATISRDALPLLTASSAAWGDFNNDGLLDLLLTGRDASGIPLTRIYRNNGDGTFTDIRAPLTGLQGGNAFWCDLNNDGFLDVVSFGSNLQPGRQLEGASAYTAVYRNNGDGSFTAVASGLPQIISGFIVSGDYDNDGRPDLLVAGVASKGTVPMTLYHNDGNFLFHAAVTNLPTFVSSSAAWCDYDKDGDLDLLVTGTLANQNPSIKLLRNDGGGVFTDVTSGLTPGSLVAWGDYDGDGWPDFVESFAASYQGTRLYRNTGAGTFTNLGVVLPSLSKGVLAWGDFDNDGLPDLLMAGVPTNVGFSQVYRNNGNGTFTNFPVTLPGASNGISAWGDFDNNGDLDLVLTGGVTELVANSAATTNTPPTPASGLMANVSGKTVMLAWAAASDAQTPAAGLNYNLRVGTAPGAQNILAPESDLATGWRRVPLPGNAGSGTNWWLRLPGGVYYWSVQAIDAGLEGSAFASEGSFTITNHAPVVTNLSITVPEDTSTNIILTGSDADGDALTFQVASSPMFGQLSGAPPNLTYKPLSNYYGFDQFTFQASDDTTNSAAATVFIQVTPVVDVAAASLGINVSLGGQLQFTPQGEPWQSYRIEASTDLVHWYPFTNAMPTNLMTLVAGGRANLPRCFFRAMPLQVVPALGQGGPVVGGGFGFAVNGEASRAYQVQASTNLTDWTPIGTLLMTNGVMQFVDPDALKYPRRFYRLVAP